MANDHYVPQFYLRNFSPPTRQHYDRGGVVNGWSFSLESAIECIDVSSTRSRWSLVLPGSFSSAVRLNSSSIVGGGEGAAMKSTVRGILAESDRPRETQLVAAGVMMMGAEEYKKSLDAMKATAVSVYPLGAVLSLQSITYIARVIRLNRKLHRLRDHVEVRQLTRLAPALCQLTGQR